jgi:hypothetical protein
MKNWIEKHIEIICCPLWWMMAGICIALILAICLCGCSWQGQKAYHDEKLVSEWWSMRFCWMSSGIESYTETPYYRSGATMAASQSDPNAIEAAGQAVGAGAGAMLKTAGGF